MILLEQVLQVEPLWESYRINLAYLSDYAILFRYPGETADKETAIKARKFIRSFRKVARLSLNV